MIAITNAQIRVTACIPRIIDSRLQLHGTRYAATMTLRHSLRNIC